MTQPDLQQQMLAGIGELAQDGHRIVVVHGGGPFIQKTLELAGITSDFIGGHRKTTPAALTYVEMALKGQVNGALVHQLNRLGHKAIGLSGKDAAFAKARRRKHAVVVDGELQEVDLGQVGDIENMDTSLIDLLLGNGYLPVVATLAMGGDGEVYNVNADLFAGHLAGALSADRYIALTDVDGLLADKDDPESLIKTVSVAALDGLVQDGTIQGGMIPKMDSCKAALECGAASAHILNGTRPEQLLRLMQGHGVGTTITLS